MEQNIIVGLIVAVAGLYIVWRYLPQRWRQRLGRVHPKLAEPAGCGSGGGGACSSCGTCGDGGDKHDHAAEKPVALPPRHGH